MIEEHVTITHDNPIVSNHILSGRPLFPGLAYVDLIFQIFDEKGFSFETLTLKHFSIHHPLIITPTTPVELHIICQGKTSGVWNIEIQATSQTVVKAEMHQETLPLLESKLDRSFDGRLIELEEMYRRCQKHGLVHSGLMKPEGDLRMTEKDLFIDLQLSDESNDSYDQFLFHPALLDGSALSSSFLLSEVAENELYLPLYFESFHARKPITKRCRALIKKKSIRQENELIYLTLIFYDDAGTQIGKLENFASKLVRGHSQDEILEKLRLLLVQHLEKDSTEVKVDEGYYEMGLDSSGLLEFAEKVGNTMGIVVPPTLLFEYTTLRELAHFIASSKGKVKQDSLEKKSEGEEEIAIIGVAGRYPKAENVDIFWENLKKGEDCITEVPPNRWDWKRYKGITSPSKKPISRWGGFLDDPDCFDSGFFKISPREAEAMDPQERLFLQTCWEAIEDAGYTPKTLTPPQGESHRNPVGVFAGVMHKDYTQIGAEALSEENLFPLSLTSASVANRISYFCNFHGPSMVVDTLCSSSLTAIHLAVESLRHGECQVALAGGVNLSLHPQKYISYGIGDMLSSDGYCHSFGEGGDGYVPAEGVGAVLLKPLKQAIKDKDHILAVIRASAVNHGGKVSGVTVPSPVAQAAVIETCLKKGGIDPSTITYVEAHGTGTSLGDPIEVQGLVKAFEKYTQNRQFCALGSVKSNIGHAESASGICGLTKVIFQLHEKTLVPSLHSEKLNLHLNLSETPFYVPQVTKPWESEVPRRAALSSFGALGSNVHLILEEYHKETPPTPCLTQPLPIIISARNSERLKAVAEKLLLSIADQVNFSDLAYTLHIGREVMEKQLILSASSIPELKEKLNDFISKGESSDEKAPDFDWSQINPKRIRLPTYPFTKDRHWISKPELISHNIKKLHPFIHKNRSTFREQRYCTTFTGREFFFSDHQVNGHSIFPGVAHLEMARAALSFALEDDTNIQLKKILWARPLAITEEPLQIEIFLFPQASEEVFFEIRDHEGLFSSGVGKIASLQESQSIDVAELLEKCRERCVEKKEIYRKFQELGLDYGPTFQCIENLHLSNNELIAEIHLPSEAKNGNFFLHPSLIDSAFHASVGFLFLENENAYKLALPFAIERVEIFHPLPSSIYSHVTLDRSKKQYDISLIDPEGTLLVRLCGAQMKEQPSIGGSLVLCHKWEPYFGQMNKKERDEKPKVVLFGGTQKEKNIFLQQFEDPRFFPISQKDVRYELDADSIFWIAPRGKKVGDNLSSFLANIRPFLKEKYLNLTVITRQAEGISLKDEIDPSHAALFGLVGTLVKERPDWDVRLVDLESGGELPLATLSILPLNRYSHPWALRKGRWFQPKLIPYRTNFSKPSLFREGGVYVIIGGSGYLGGVLSDHLARNYKATLIWIGRRPHEDSIESKRKQIAKLGASVYYYSTKEMGLEKVIEGIQTEFKVIHGIIHSSMVLEETPLESLDKELLDSALEAKIGSSFRICEALANLKLDFILFFSSLVSHISNPRQGAYASGCTAADAFAKRLSHKVSCPVKIMNWGYWGDENTRKDQLFKERLATQGLAVIDPVEGMKIVEHLLSSQVNQLAMVNTTREITLEGMDSSDFITKIEKTAPHIDLEKLPQSQKRINIGDDKEFNSLLLQLLSVQLETLSSSPITEHQKWYKESLVLIDKKSSLDSESIWGIWEKKSEEWRKDLNKQASAILVEKALRALPSILMGKISPVDVLFPNGSMELVEGIYKNNAIFDHFNEVVADAIEFFISNSNSKLKILEIGAGTGGTSSQVLERLSPYCDRIEEYTYTDLSKAFLTHAEKKFANKNPFLKTQIFDVEASLKGQGFSLGEYDLVIAANVLHATKNIRHTVRNSKALLKKGGWFILKEMTSKSLFAHLTFGLLEGWWLHEDSEWRIKGCPGLSSDSWDQILKEEGFGQVIFPAKKDLSLGLQVVVATSDGVVHQSNLQKRLLSHHENEKTSPKIVDDNVFKETIEKILSRLVSTSLKIPLEHLDVNAPLENYGIDSIVIVELTNGLSKVIGEVSSSLFFEYQSISAIAAHLIETGGESLHSHLKIEKKFHQQDLKTVRKKKVFLKSSLITPFEKQDIAIIGMSGRFPKANRLQEFWVNLKEGRDCVTTIPKERWDWEAYYDPQKGKPGTSYSKWGAFIDDHDCFDPAFFNISPLEAEGMDPQERCFLETSYAAIEDAGYIPQDLNQHGKVGVFVGAMNKFYPSGYGYWSFANRLSYFFNFRGPSLAVDTACSGALTAIHLAVESLANGSCACAIAGGVNLILTPQHQLNLSMMQMLSSGNKCRSFGKEADGFVDGEGVGTLILKPIDRAIEDGDHICGVIKGSAINSGGKTNGYTVPNPLGQAEVIIDALDKAKISPETVSYIEAHGTGTALGDPIEIRGLTKAFGDIRGNTCAIGSVKSQIGHSESAAGVAGVIKVLLQMKHKQLVPSLHSEVSNPNINFDATPFRVQHTLEEWRNPLDTPRRAGVSSFGAGGANAHVILEEYIPSTSESFIEGPYIILLSAKNLVRLIEKAAQLEEALGALEPKDLPRIAFTLQTGRVAMEERLGIEISSLDELREKLSVFINQGAEAEGLLLGNSKESYKFLTIFEKDDDTDGLIDLWFEKRKLSKLLEIWINGWNLDWNRLYRSNAPTRISLPSYPFAREKFWTSELPREEIIKPKSTIYLFKERWEEQAIQGLKNVKPRDFAIFGENVLKGSLDAIFYIATKKGNKDPEPFIDLLQSTQNETLRKIPIFLAFSGTTALERCYFEAWVALERSLPERSLIPIFHKDPLSREAWISLLSKEWAANTKTSVLYENGKRKIARLRPLLLSSDRKKLKQESVIFITGGLGSLGFLFAKYFAKTYKARLILSGRSPIDLTKIQILEHLGGEVLYIQGDITDIPTMKLELDIATARFGEVTGIIHAAGVLSQRSIYEKSVKEFKAVLQPKIDGTLALETLFNKKTPEFTVLFSSSSAVLGDFGACDYAAGNRFQMAHSRLLGKNVTAILWPIWREGGMKIGDEKATEQYLEATGQYLLETEEGVDLFERLLKSNEHQVLVLSGDEMSVNRLVMTHSVEKKETTGELENLISELMKIPIERIQPDSKWTDFGMNSIHLSELASRLSKTLGRDIGPSLFFNYPTLKSLKHYFESTDKDVLAMMEKFSEGEIDFENLQSVLERVK